MKRNAHIGKILKSAAIASLVLCYVSCVEDNEIASQQTITKSDVMTFNIGYSNKWEPDVIGDAKSSSPRGSNSSRTAALPMDCDGELPNGEILMYMVEEDCPTVVDTMSVDSRTGEQTTTSSFDATDVGIFATLTNGDTTEEFFKNISRTNYKDDTYWPGYGTLQFFAYSPYIQTEDLGKVVNGLTLNWTDNVATFNYTVPATPATQIDLLAGVSEELPGNPFEIEGATGEVKLELSHIMSKIQVKADAILEGKIVSISFENIYTTGTRSLASENWTVTTTKANEGDIITNDYIQSWENGFEIPVEGEKIIGSPMYLMPQVLTDAAVIKVGVKVPSKEEPYYLSKSLKSFAGGEWKSGKVYTYVISTPSELQIEVNDAVTENVKSELEIKNTGLSAAWIRVMLYGEWVVETIDENNVKTRNIVGLWDEQNDGTFKDLDNNSYWIRPTGDDHYYYRYELQRGDIAQPLFDTYTLTASPPEAGAVLELSVVVQAFEYNDIKDLWPVAAVALIEE